jgi:hypothetical protein
LCIHRFKFNNSSKEKKNVSNSINPGVIFDRVRGERVGTRVLDGGRGKRERIAENSKFTYLVVLNPMC